MQTCAPAPTAIRFSELSPQRQVLVRLCQQTNYGFIRDLEIRERQPVFDRPPVVLVDLKLDGADQPRPEMALADFQLPGEVLRLLDRLDELITTKVESLEVRAGLPRRVVLRIAAPLTTSTEDARQESEARR
jgi:hypothetical protein